MAINERANAGVQEAINRSISERGEIGVQVAAYLDGELVIDAWGGMADPDSGREVDGDTLFNVFSVTKAVVATTIHIQAEQGRLEYDEPIARYWPEWGCNGKEDITVRDALTHHTGVPQMPDGTTVETICDWEFMVEGLAKLSPLLPRGKPAYQALSFGWILGEIVRRTDPQHRPYARFIQEELCQPLDIPDLWVGTPDAVAHRIATLSGSGSSGLAPADSLHAKALPYGVRLGPDVYKLPEVRRACIAATGGIFTARSEARFWAMLANGGELDGVRLLSKERVDAACVARSGSDPDPVMFNATMRLSQGGYWLHDPKMPSSCAATGPRTICVPGAGGSLGWADPDTRLAVAFCHNHMRPYPTCEEHPAFHVASAVRQSLGL